MAGSDWFYRFGKIKQCKKSVIVCHYFPMIYKEENSGKKDDISRVTPGHAG